MLPQCYLPHFGITCQNLLQHHKRILSKNALTCSHSIFNQGLESFNTQKASSKSFQRVKHQ